MLFLTAAEGADFVQNSVTLLYLSNVCPNLSVVLAEVKAPAWGLVYTGLPVQTRCQVSADSPHQQVLLPHVSVRPVPSA